jgi:3-oxoacyl-[acyl-carrier protein] reductase
MSDADFLKGKVAVVTGGSRGIGRAIVLMLAKAGCQVAFNYQSRREAADKLEEEVKDYGGKARASCVDVRDFEAVKLWIGDVKEEFGQLDILINNAGIIIDKALMLMSREDWGKVIDTNLNGMFNVSRACIVAFLKQKKGDVVNISSVSGVIGLPRQTNYSAAKGGMNAFTKSLAKEVAAYGVRVNAVAPGFIETDILSDLTEKQREEITQSVPLGRIGDVEDVADCVKFLLSPESQYIIGQIIQIDGGLAIR